ncbi:hypothetical protein [Micromonospora sp. NPDC047527]
MRQLATDNQIGVSTDYDYVNIDGILVETDRCRTSGPTGVDLR